MYIVVICFFSHYICKKLRQNISTYTAEERNLVIDNLKWMKFYMISLTVSILLTEIPIIFIYKTSPYDQLPPDPSQDKPPAWDNLKQLPLYTQRVYSE